MTKNKTTMKKTIFTLAAFSLLLVGCGEENVKLNPANDNASSNLAAGSQSEEELRAAAEKRKEEQRKKEEEKLANQTTMEISPKEFDFGTIAKETPVSKTFTITNTGDKPLVINDAKASCGCTVPKKPEEPIAPGDSGELEVTFTSNKGQAGQNISKNVTVSANVPNGSQIVKIKAQVEE